VDTAEGEETQPEGEGSPNNSTTTGLMIPPRTPVLEKDPLRALSSTSSPSFSPLSSSLEPPKSSLRDKQGASPMPTTMAASPAGGDAAPAGAKERRTNKATEDMAGLKTLMQAGWWRDAASLAEKLTKRSRWPHERLHFKMCLIVALAKTRQYRKAMDELDSLGDLEGPANFYESYPNLYQDRHGSMVPFSLLVLRAEMPSFVGSSDGLARSLDALFGLLECCRTQLSQLATNAPTSAASAASSEPSTLNKADLDALSALTVSQQVPSALSFINDLDQDVAQTWRGREVRILFSISTRYLQNGDYASALNILSSLLPLYPRDIILLSTIGRLLLQWGNVVGAERYFREVEQLVPEPSKSAVVMMNRGLESIGRDHFLDAMRAFEAVLELEPDNTWAANNQAVCWLYLRDLQSAIKSLEQLIAANPEANLIDIVISNLCTLYELESNNSAGKKKGLLSIISQFSTDELDATIVKA